MGSVTIKSDGAIIVYDDDLFGKIEAAFFEPEYWRSRGALTGEAHGRGSTWFVRHRDGELALRHYRRGGILAPWLRDRYLWLGLDATRAMREWALLRRLHREGLPVPRAAAARVQPRGWYYRADLITERIAEAHSLAETLAHGPLEGDAWRAIGACVHRLHSAGVCHADLNAHNILLAARRVYVVDFDRGRIRGPGAWMEGNLARLRRSLEKLAHLRVGFHFAESDWAALRAGYAQAGVNPARGAPVTEAGSPSRSGD